LFALWSSAVHQPAPRRINVQKIASFLSAVARELIQPFPLLLVICVAPRILTS
jgi:hypothetical protein